MMAKKLKPVHPGEILREEFLAPLGLSMNRVAMDLRVPVTRIADIVNERRGITADTALRFARYFKNSPAFWMNLQTRYDLEVAEDEIAVKVARDVQPLEAVTTREAARPERSEEHTSELQSLAYLVCRLLLEKKKNHKASTLDSEVFKAF